MQDFEFPFESLDHFLFRCQTGDALTGECQRAMLFGGFDPAAEGRLVDPQVVRNPLIGVSWLLGELYGLLLELGAVKHLRCAMVPPVGSVDFLIHFYALQVQAHRGSLSRDDLRAAPGLLPRCG